MENLSVWLSILLNSIPVCITCSSSCYSKRLNSHLLFDVCKIEIQPPEIFLRNINRAKGAEVGGTALIAARVGCILKSGVSQWSGSSVYLCNKQSGKSPWSPGVSLQTPKVNDWLLILPQIHNVVFRKKISTTVNP